MVLFYKIWKKYNENQLIKNKMDFVNRKITNLHPNPNERDWARLNRANDPCLSQPILYLATHVWKSLS